MLLGQNVTAEELLKRRRLATAQAQGSSQGSSSDGGIKRAFTTNKKKEWESKGIFDALDAHIGNGRSAGVAEALIAKLVLTGGDVNEASSVRGSRISLLTRRRSMEMFECSRLL